jgi:hypothetical protein
LRLREKATERTLVDRPRPRVPLAAPLLREKDDDEEEEREANSL